MAGASEACNRILYRHGVEHRCTREKGHSGAGLNYHYCGNTGYSWTEYSYNDPENKDHVPPTARTERLQIDPSYFQAKAPELAPGLANRHPQKTDYSQLSHVALRLMAETQAEGNAKYGIGNWQKGIPISNLLSHALDHIFKLQNGDVTENHLGHALWNLEKAAHFIELRPELIDIAPLKEALKPEGVLMKPADPNPNRNTLCWFCGKSVDGTHKVISGMYRQAHIRCFTEAETAEEAKFLTGGLT